ncbi:MAG: guanylate kinase [Lachnospiraceae bacterium]|nr:guanylate kinase [Lachnospiraceae bacterium]MBQ9592529.1 guanylate kinase [Lachnospiraceae bacterium]MBR0153906.1 guanylate kinase [Lachnospiraceae bacterium]
MTEEKKKGILTVVSGFSGAGKGTLMKALLADYDYDLSVSATTRAPRAGEVDGREYFFLTRDAFESMINNGEFIEWAEFVGNYYGTPRAYVEEKLAAGRDVLLEIEVQGAMNIKKQFPDALLVFVTPPSAEELKRRLVNRGTETEEVIAKRLSRACEEAAWIEQYDILLVNDDLEECVRTLDTIIHDAIAGIPYEVSENQAMIAEIRSQLEKYRLGGNEL